MQLAAFYDRPMLRCAVAQAVEAFAASVRVLFKHRNNKYRIGYFIERNYDKINESIKENWQGSQKAAKMLLILRYHTPSFPLNGY